MPRPFQVGCCIFLAPRIPQLIVIYLRKELKCPPLYVVVYWRCELRRPPQLVVIYLPWKLRHIVASIHFHSQKNGFFVIGRLVIGRSVYA